MRTSDLKPGTFYQLHRPRQGGCDMPSLCGRFIGVDPTRLGQAKLKFQLADAIHARDWKTRVSLQKGFVYMTPAAVVGEWEPFAERMARVMSFRASTRLLGCTQKPPSPSLISRAERLGVFCTEREGMFEISPKELAALLEMAERRKAVAR